MRNLPCRRPALNLAVTLALCGALLVTACANAPPPQAVASPSLLADALFAPQAQPFDPQSLFTLDEPMLAYLRLSLPRLRLGNDNRRALMRALFEQNELKLRYDGGQTRTAAEAFAARAGNCLSLVIMTAAFAKHLELPVAYRSVAVPDTYSRSGELYMASGHVNLVLGPPPIKTTYSTDQRVWLTVDFLPQEDLGQQRVTPLSEATIVAMYLNNRAAESLTDNQVDQAYGWARQAVLQDPTLAAAVNTLAVVYQRAGHLAQAEAALRHVLAADPVNTAAMSNLVGLLSRTGRAQESAALAQRLAQLQPVAPFHHFKLGRQAMAQGDLAAAQEHLEAELRLQPYQDEVHFWLAQLHWRLGHTALATRHLRLAAEHSLSGSSHARYTAKLDLLRDQSQVH